MTADPRIPWNYTLPNNNLARTMEECITSLAKQGINWTVSGTGVDEGGLWCNATWDTVLCWPPIPANTSITLPCPAMKGLDPKKSVSKMCDATGRWMGKKPGVYENAWGWTNFTGCFMLDYEDVKIAQEVAQKARNIEFVGLGLSLISLTISIFIITYFRRLRVFRNLMHLHLMIAILMVTIIRLIIYIDLIVGGNYGGPHSNSNDGKTINTMPIVCEMMYLLLEYFKTVSFMWMFLEGFNLHNLVVLSVFNADPQLMPYVIVGYGAPFLNVVIWLLFMSWKKGWKLEHCLGPYYLEAEFRILNGPRMLELFMSFFFIFNIIRVLWTKVSEPHQAGDQDRIWKSVKAALMLCFLLGLPNIMQTIPFTPTRDNIMIFAVWTYFASFTYMYQGLFIAIIYCFINKEVTTVLKNAYYRYRLQHTSQSDLRRGSKSLASRYKAKNGQVTMVTVVNNNENSSPQTGRSKKGSGDSTTKLMLGVPNHDENSSCNGYGTTVSERTPLNEADMEEMKKGQILTSFISLAL